MSDRATAWARHIPRAPGRHGPLYGKPGPALVLLELADHVNNTDVCTCYRSVPDIAAAVDLSDNAVTHGIKLLEQLDLVAVFRVTRGGHEIAQRYVLNLDGLTGREWLDYADRWANVTEVPKGHRAVNRRELVVRPARRRSAARQPRLPLDQPQPRNRKEAPVGVLGAMDGPVAQAGSPTPEDRTIWNRAKADLGLATRREDYLAWYSEAELYAREGDTWLIEVPGRDVADWLNAKCTDQVKRSLLLYLPDGTAATVQFIASPEPTW